MASLSATITNLVLSVHGGKDPKYKSIDDFLPKWDTILDEKIQEPKKQSANEMRDILMAFAVNHNRSIEDKKKKK